MMRRKWSEAVTFFPVKLLSNKKLVYLDTHIHKFIIYKNLFIKINKFIKINLF